VYDAIVPLQQSWVELWLERYCPAGRDQMAPYRFGLLRCDACGKEELPGGATCLICGIPGEKNLVLEHRNGDFESYAGRLCGPCVGDFTERESIRGWRIARAG
jgi:hypothetical protein